MENKSHSPSSSSGWIVVYSANNVVEAHVVAGRLQSEGVPAWVHQEPLGSSLGITVGFLGEVNVLVNAEDFDRACSILDEELPDELPDDVDRIIYDDDEDFDDE